MADYTTKFVRRTLEIVSVPSNKSLAALKPDDTLISLELSSQDLASIALSLQNLAAAFNDSARIKPSDVTKSKTVAGIVKLALVTAKLADKTIPDKELESLMSAAQNLTNRTAGPMLSHLAPPSASAKRKPRKIKNTLKRGTA